MLSEQYVVSYLLCLMNESFLHFAKCFTYILRLGIWSFYLVTR